MSTPRLIQNPALLPVVMDFSQLRDKDFFLVDVGASGGVEPHWSVFGSHLRAVGFDPLVNEVQRLNGLNKSPKIKYEEGFVTCPEWKELTGAPTSEDLIRLKDNQIQDRTSSVLAQQVAKIDYVKERFNSNSEVVYSKHHLVLDEFFPAERQAEIDFLKVDTDGHDFQVLRGAEKILRSGHVLGLSVEAQLHGALGGKSNTFANIDTFLRGMGYSLFDLEVYRYSRGALPAPFVYNITAQTLRGQVSWGEAVYFRDLAHPNYEAMWAYDPSEAKILKLACLFELFGLADCAAELLIKYKGRFESLAKTEQLLDLLTPTLQGSVVGYEKYMKAFRADPRTFFPSHLRSIATSTSSSAPSAAAPSTPTALTDHAPSGSLDYHASGRPRSKPSPLSLRGIRQRLHALFGG